MSARGKARAPELAADARAILHALIDAGDLVVVSERRARVSFTISLELFEALCAFDADDEDDEIDRRKRTES